ncbi:MAG: hypothetical protein HDT15_03990 [Oscillibacter sp.]|nr:hypothetical protein [Oscillibacter sp.]
MKLSDLRTRIYNTFGQTTQRVSKKFSEMGIGGKIAMAASIVGLFVFITGKNLPDLFRLIVPPTSPIEDSITEDKSDKNNDTNDDKSNGANIDVNIDGTININGDENNGVKIEVNQTGVDTNEDDDKSTKGLTISPSDYREELKRAIGSDMYIAVDYYNDFNDDEGCEMFALVVRQKEISGAEYYDYDDSSYMDRVFYCGNKITGEIWFVDQDGARKLEEKTTDWSVWEPFQVGNRKFFRYGQDYTASGSITFLWGVNEEGQPYQPNISGKGCGLYINNYHEIELTCSTIDACYSAEDGFLLGHTWKPYYFYWGGKNFKEYGGKSIFIDQVYSISGSEELLEQAYSELKNSYNNIQIKDIYYRENGIININYECKVNNSDSDYYNHNLTLHYVDGTLKIVPWEDFGPLCREGKYTSELITSIATPPESSFESLFF